MRKKNYFMSFFILAMISSLQMTLASTKHVLDDSSPVNKTISIVPTQDNHKKEVLSFASPALIELPREILILILGKTETSDLLNIRKSCKYLSELTYDNLVLMPPDDETFINRILTVFKDVYRGAISAKSPDILKRLTTIADMHNIHYCFKNYALDELTRNWEIYYKSLLLAKQLNDPKAMESLEEELDRKSRRLENYGAYLRKDDNSDTIGRFYWEQVAYFDEEKRQELIEAYKVGKKPIPQDLKRAAYWGKFSIFEKIARPRF